MPHKGVRKRLTRRKHHSLVTSPVLRPSAKRKQWTDSQMLAALKAVESGTGINKAAREHGVPATTLKDRVSGRVAHGTKPGPRPYLSTEEETELGTFLKNCTSVGYGKTRKDVLLIAESVAREKDVLKKECITSGWWNKFLKHQGDLSTISKYLVCTANTTPSGIGRKSLPHARLLTRLAMLEEKEKKQQDEKERKEKQKKEREEKKKQRGGYEKKSRRTS